MNSQNALLQKAQARGLPKSVICDRARYKPRSDVTSPNNYIPANTLDRAPLARKCVARIWLENRDAGTGILLEGDWLLTCHHVLPTLEKAKGALAQFGYEQLSDGFFSPMLQYKFDPDAGYHFSTADKDDWAVVKLKGGPNKAIGFFPLDEEAAPAKGAHVTIIQHPNADPKQVADGPIIEVVDSPARRVRYVVAVEGGSSGSPVFDTRWRVGLASGPTSPALETIKLPRASGS